MQIDNHETICLIYSPDLTTLNYPDDLLIHTAFNNELSMHLKPYIERNEKIYSLSSHGLLIRLKKSNEMRIASFYHIVNSYVFIWNCRQIHFHCGISYTKGKIDAIAASNLFIILSEKIPTSIKNNHPEIVELYDIKYRFI